MFEIVFQIISTNPVPGSKIRQNGAIMKNQ
jgi:hypothetical protein